MESYLRELLAWMDENEGFISVEEEDELIDAYGERARAKEVMRERTNQIQKVRRRVMARVRRVTD